MKPHQYAEVSAQILKDRGTAYGDYTKLFDNIATRWNLVYADKLKPGEKFVGADVARGMAEVKNGRMDCGKATPDNIYDGANYLFLFGGLTDEK